LRNPSPISRFSPGRRTTLFWVKAAALLILPVATYLVMQHIDIGEVFNPDRITQWLSQAGPWAPFLFMGLMALAVIISPIPSLPLDIAAGAAFGPFLGASYAVLGAELGAIVSFLIGRALGREVLTRLLRMNIAFCETCSDHHLAIFVFLSRLLPIFSFDLNQLWGRAHQHGSSYVWTGHLSGHDPSNSCAYLRRKFCHRRNMAHGVPWICHGRAGPSHP
jgi:hypothetical protein